MGLWPLVRPSLQASSASQPGLRRCQAMLSTSINSDYATASQDLQWSVQRQRKPHGSYYSGFRIMAMQLIPCL